MKLMKFMSQLKRAGSGVYWELCKRFELDHCTNRHNLDAAIKNTIINIFRDFFIETRTEYKNEKLKLGSIRTMVFLHFPKGQHIEIALPDR